MAGRKRTPLRPGDEVSWNTRQGVTHGKVTRRVTGKAKAGGHTARASAANPQLEVRSAKSGKTAIHKPGALRKTKPSPRSGSSRRSRRP